MPSRCRCQVRVRPCGGHAMEAQRQARHSKLQVHAQRTFWLHSWGRNAASPTRLRTPCALSTILCGHAKKPGVVCAMVQLVLANDCTCM